MFAVILTECERDILCTINRRPPICLSAAILPQGILQLSRFYISGATGCSTRRIACDFHAIEFTITCVLVLSAADMWHIRASARFRRHLVQERRLQKLDCTSLTPNKGRYWKPKQRYIPTKVECSNFLHSIIDNTLFDVTDEQRWNDETEPLHQRFLTWSTHLSSF